MNNKNCLDCAYFGGATDSIACCNYIFIKDERRPCDPGEGCTVKMQRERKRKMKKTKKQKEE